MKARNEEQLVTEDFMQEVKSMYQLDHKNIIKLYGVVLSPLKMVSCVSQWNISSLFLVKIIKICTVLRSIYCVNFSLCCL